MKRATKSRDLWGEIDLLADPIRRAIFLQLVEGPLHVSALVERLPVTQSAVSQHLKKMKASGLVSERREGKFVFYQANPAALPKLVAQLDVFRSKLTPQPLSGADPADPTQPRTRVSIESDNIDAVMASWNAQWPLNDALTLGILFRLHLIADKLKNNLTRTVARFRLNSMELNLLATLERLGPPYESTLTELSRLIQRSLPVVSRYLERAVQNGFICRLPKGRSTTLRLTDKGREALHQIIDNLRENDLAKLYQMPNEQRQLIAQATRDLLDAIDISYAYGDPILRLGE